MPLHSTDESNAQDLFTTSRYKCKYASPSYYINIRSLIFQNISKCALVLFQLSSAFVLAWLAAYDAPASLPKKAMQSFLRKINFFRRFVPCFLEMVRPLQNLIKKDGLYRWGPQEIQSFDSIRKEIIEAPSLMSPDFSQDFSLYTFASDISYVVVLTQKNTESNEIPIAFMRSAFKGA
jgi:hypothetical protein